jgi:hypothetical protein
VHVHPEFLLGVVLHARVVLVVQAVKGPTDHGHQCLVICGVILEPLTVLDQLDYICACAHAPGQPACSVTSKTEQSNYSGPTGEKLWMIAGLLDHVLSLLLNDWPHNRCCVVLVQVDPGHRGILVAFFLLSSIVIDPLLAVLAQRALVLVVLQILKPLRS